MGGERCRKQKKKYDEQQKKVADFNKDLNRQLQDAVDTLTGNDFAKTLRDAAEKKGSALTGDEVEKLRMLSELQTMSRNHDTHSGSFGRMTNSLAQRGGFNSSVVDPKVNRTQENILAEVKAIPGSISSFRASLEYALEKLLRG